MQKIYVTCLKKFAMITILFEIVNQRKKYSIFKKKLFLINLSRKIVLQILFLNLNKVKINFLELELFCIIYTLIVIMLIIIKIKLRGKKDFAIIILKPKKKI